MEIDRLKGKTVRFTDGTSMDLDVVVVAAGYKNMSESVRAVLQPAVVPGQAGTAPSWLVPVLAVSIGVLLLILAVAAITSVSRRR